MNQKPKHTEPSTNSYAAAYGYVGFSSRAQASQGASRRRTLTELGSSSWITDAGGNACAERSRSISQHLQYLPFGESRHPEPSRRIDQRTNHDIRFKFTTKEEDSKTGYTYFGARYYDSDISVWLSVDPLAEKNFGVSPYNYCHWNPIMMIDPDGRNDGWVENDGEVFWDADVNTQSEANTKYGNDAVYHEEYIANENNNNYFLAEDGSVWTASNSTPSERVFSAENGTNVGGELSGVTVIADNSHQYNSSVLGLSLTLSVADGPFPFGDIIGCSILAAYTGYYIGQYIVDKIGNAHYPDQVYTIPDPTGNIPFNNPPRGPGNHNIPKGAWWFMVAEGAYETYKNYKEKLDLVPKPQVAPRDKTDYKQRIYPTP